MTVVAVALPIDGVQVELTDDTFHINQLKDYYKVIGPSCDYVTPVTLTRRPALTMWVDEDAKMRPLGTPNTNEFATIILASFTHRVIDIAGTVIFTGALGQRILPIHATHLRQLRDIEEGRKNMTEMRCRVHDIRNCTICINASVARHPAGKGLLEQ